MGRGFSTFYRITLMAMGLTALVLSALSATSCAFLQFDHQYGESSIAGGGGGGGFRSLSSVDSLLKTSHQSIMINNNDRRELPESSAIPEHTGDSFVASTTTIPTISWLPDDTNGTMASGSSVSSPSSSSSSSASTSTGASVHHSPAASPTSQHSSTMPTHKSSHKNNSSGGQEASSSSSATSSSSSTTTTAAVAQVAGEAGLFCDGQSSTFISSLWGESSVADFEDKIANESNQDQSEELARNAVVAALVFGSFTLVVMLLECILGWRVWCDKLLVGLLAFMACVSQGVTFLFFDSDRYCDGDLVNEIINAKPCVLGSGGVYSVVAVIMYAIMIIMACRLPKDDPYGLCCKKRSGRNSGTESMSGGDAAFGLVGSKESESETDNTADGQEGEQRTWVSEDKRRDVEENEII